MDEAVGFVCLVGLVVYLTEYDTLFKQEYVSGLGFSLKVSSLSLLTLLVMDHRNATLM